MGDHEPDQRHGALLRATSIGFRRTWGVTTFVNNILVSIVVENALFGFAHDLRRNLVGDSEASRSGRGLEIVDIVSILRDHWIHEKAIFYGLDEIVTERLVWRVFALIKRLAPTFVQFYRLPADLMHGVSTRIDM